MKFYHTRMSYQHLFIFPTNDIILYFSLICSKLKFDSQKLSFLETKYALIENNAIVINL